MKAQICGSMLLVIFILAATYSHGDNKVVVIPVNGSSPVAVGYVGGEQILDITDIDTVVRTLTLEIPNNGLVIVNASGHVSWVASTDNTSAARCSITQGTTIDYAYLSVVGSEGANNTVDNLTLSMTRAFPLEKGSQTFNLVCDTYASSDDIRLRDINMNAIYYYVPDISLPKAVGGDTPLNTHNCDLNIFCD